jgi:hypothetical protein
MMISVEQSVEYKLPGETEVLGENQPPQIPHDLTWDQTRAAAVGSRRLTVWAMARPAALVIWLSLLFGPDDGGRMFLRHVGELSDCMTLHLKKTVTFIFLSGFPTRFCSAFHIWPVRATFPQRLPP